MIQFPLQVENQRPGTFFRNSADYRKGERFHCWLGEINKYGSETHQLYLSCRVDMESTLFSLFKGKERERRAKMELLSVSTAGLFISPKVSESVVEYSRRGGVECGVRIWEVLIRERMWAFWPLPDYHQMGRQQQQQQQQLGPTAVWGLREVEGKAMEDTTERVKGQKERLLAGTFHHISGTASYFTCWHWPEEFILFLGYLHDVLCVQDKKVDANCADGNSWLFNLLYPLLCHYLWLPLQGAPSCASNRLCQFINRSSSRRMLFFSPWMIGPDSLGDPVTLKRQSRIFFFPHLNWAHHSPVPAKFKYTIHHRETHLLSLLLSSVEPPLLFKYVFYTVLLHSHLKASDFNKAIKKGKESLFGFLCVFSDLIWQL